MLLGRTNGRKNLTCFDILLPALLSLALCILLPVMTAAAIQPIPGEDGFSGFINLGAGLLSVKSNLVAGTRLFEVGETQIDSLTGPGRESRTIAILNGDIRYTFAESRTQVFAGNSLENLLRLDFVTALGIRKAFSDESIGSISYLFNSIVTEVWQDPFVTGSDREKTDRSSNGVRLTWQNPVGTALGIKYTWRSIDIEDERSGTLGNMGLTSDQIAVLNRNGSSHDLEFNYTWQRKDGLMLMPAYRYSRNDRDGGAISYDGHTAILTLVRRSDHISFSFTGSWGTHEHGDTHPIFGETQSSTLFGFLGTIIWHQPFGLRQGFNLLGSVSYFREDANIDFNDARVSLYGLSLLYRF